MSYFYRREVIQQSLEIIWRKKYLWFLGFFAGLVAHGGEADVFFRDTNSINWLQSNLQALREVIQTGEGDYLVDQIRGFFTAYPVNALSLVGAVLLTMAAVFWLVIVSQAAIVYIIGRTAEKKSASLFEGLAVGAEKFWTLVGINIIAKLFTWGLWIILAGLPAIAFFISGDKSWVVTFVVGSLLVTMPINLLVSFLTKYAIASISLEKTNIVNSLRKAWHLFRTNWLISLELAVIIYAINFGVTIIVSGVTLLFFQTIRSFNELFALLAILAAALAFISSFSYAAWTIVYQKLVAGKGESKIGYWTTRLTDFMEAKKTNG